MGRLTADCLTIWLHRNDGGGVPPPVVAIELSNNGRGRADAAVVPGAGIEPALTGSESVVLPTRRSRNASVFVGGMGIEPTSIGLRGRCVALTPTSRSRAVRLGHGPRARSVTGSHRVTWTQQLGVGGRTRTSTARRRAGYSRLSSPVLGTHVAPACGGSEGRSWSGPTPAPPSETKKAASVLPRRPTVSTTVFR